MYEISTDYIFEPFAAKANNADTKVIAHPFIKKEFEFILVITF